jgi:hypothetical protein
MPRGRPHLAGQPTRGKTATNRLRRADVFVALAYARVLRGGTPLVVDLGFGARPWTTLELADSWRRVNPSLRVVGLEIDPERVAAAAPYSEPPAVAFALGGFNLAESAALGGGEKARIVRCMNVLRQYEEGEVAGALGAMAAVLEPGGLLIEGTSDPSGAMVVFDVWRRTEEPAPADGPAPLLAHESLVFGTNFREPHRPGDFRAVLPKRLIHHALDETPARFFADWERAYSVALAANPGTSRRKWTAAAAAMRAAGWPVDPRPRLAERGFLVVGSELISG